MPCRHARRKAGRSARLRKRRAKVAASHWPHSASSILDVLRFVSFPQQGAVVDTADDQFLGVLKLPLVVAARCAADHGGQRAVHGEPVFLGGCLQGVVTPRGAELVGEAGGVGAEVL